MLAKVARGDSGAVVMARTFAPALVATSAAWTMPAVVPEPEAAMRRSPEAMAGVVISPATWTVRPRCMRRMAAILSARPLRPAPVTKTRGAARMAWMAALAWASLTCARVSRSSLRTRNWLAKKVGAVRAGLGRVDEDMTLSASQAVEAGSNRKFRWVDRFCLSLDVADLERVMRWL